MKVAIGTEVTESIPSGLKGSSNSLAAGGASRATDGGCFLGMPCQETEAGLMGEVCYSHSMVPMSGRLIAAVMSSEGSAVSPGGGRMSVEVRV